MTVNRKKNQELEILSGPVPTSTTAHTIDFNKTNIKEYADFLAMTIEDVLTQRKCADLLKLVSPPNGTAWPPATVTVYNGSQILDSKSRFSDRIFYTSLIPPEIITLKNAPAITGQFPIIHELRFLKYGPGQYFRPHCDGHFVDEDGAESFLTVHLYLNGGNDVVEGGATRFAVDFNNPDARTLDINPKAGSLVIFQQKDMNHEGVEVMRGTKYTMRTDVMYKKVGMISQLGH
ncbi:hypothetical protein F4804DRAFT_345025 [Jackrogersella minutella]|nr:hypothetical protein F4804DRAFT_345025 [Jackrogersella minutella]